MYFDIFALVSAKRNTFAINCQTVVVTSLRTASLDHHRLDWSATDGHLAVLARPEVSATREEKIWNNTNFERKQNGLRSSAQESVGRAHVHLWLRWEEHRLVGSWSAFSFNCIYSCRGLPAR